jgi:hypothetical protein
VRHACATPARLPLALLFFGAAGLAADGCTDDQKPGVLIRVRGEAGNLPDLVTFDWMAPGYPVLISGQLAAHPVASDPTLFGTLFIESQAALVEDRVIAMRGRRDGEIVSGGYGLVAASFETIRTRDIMLGAPLADTNNNGIPDIVERCTNPQTAERCSELHPETDGGPPPSSDGPEPDGAEPDTTGAETSAPPDASPDAAVTDAPTDTRDAGVAGLDGSIPISLPPR